MFQPATIVQLHMQHYRSSTGYTSVMCSAAPHQHTHAPGRTVALEISILAARDIN